MITKEHITLKDEHNVSYLYDIHSQTLYLNKKKDNNKKSVFFNYIGIMLKDLLVNKAAEFGSRGTKHV